MIYAGNVHDEGYKGSERPYRRDDADDQYGLFIDILINSQSRWCAAHLEPCKICRSSPISSSMRPKKKKPRDTIRIQPCQRQLDWKSTTIQHKSISFQTLASKPTQAMAATDAIQRPWRTRFPRPAHDPPNWHHLTTISTEADSNSAREKTDLHMDFTLLERSQD